MSKNSIHIHEPYLRWWTVSKYVLIVHVPHEATIANMEAWLEEAKSKPPPNHPIVFVWDFEVDRMPVGNYLRFIMNAAQAVPSNHRHTVFINSPATEINHLMSMLQRIHKLEMSVHYVESWKQAEPLLAKLSEEVVNGSPASAS